MMFSELTQLQHGLDEKTATSRVRAVINEFVDSFRQAVATEGFKFGPVTLKNPDLNRVHSIVNVIDSKRAFYDSAEDQAPGAVWASVNEVREAVMKESSGVWANENIERIVQEITHVLNDFVTKLKRLDPDNSLTMKDYSRWQQFVDLIGEMRFQVWVLVAYLKKKCGRIIRPRHLPKEIMELVSSSELY